MTISRSKRSTTQLIRKDQSIAKDGKSKHQKSHPSQQMSDKKISELSALANQESVTQPDYKRLAGTVVNSDQNKAIEMQSTVQRKSIVLDAQESNKPVVQMNGPAWKKSAEEGIHTSAVADALLDFLSNFQIVEQGELNPEVGFPDPDVHYEANTKETHDAAPLLIKVNTSKAEKIRGIAKQVLMEMLAEAKTEEGRKRILSKVGAGGLAKYIEDCILDRVLPYMDVSLKSLVPMGRWRKNDETLMGFIEGMTDVVYNSCGIAIEGLSGALATPLVAAGGGAYKGGFAAASVKRRGGTKEQAAASASVTAAAETGQAMIPFAGGVWGITGGSRQMAKSTRIRERISNYISGKGGGSDVLKERSNDMGDERVVALIENRLEHAYELLALASKQPGLQEEVSKLGKAIKWLHRQHIKSTKRYKKSDTKGKRALLASAAGAGAGAESSSEDELFEFD